MTGWLGSRARTALRHVFLLAACAVLLSLAAPFLQEAAQTRQQFTAAVSGGTVSGRVMWVDGAPSAGAAVTAIATSAVGMEKTGWVMGTAAAASTVTDSNGNYRIAGLPPGLYHLVTGPVYLPRTFSDVSIRSTSVHLVSVTAGNVSTDIDFTCVRDGERAVYDTKRLLTVTGKLVLAPIGSPYGIHLDMNNSDGSISRYQFRGDDIGRNFYWWPGYDAAPGGMLDKMSKAGETVTVSGFDSGYVPGARNPGLHILTVNEVTRGGLAKP